MKVRILRHEKHTDNIRIGRAFDVSDDAESLQSTKACVIGEHASEKKIFKSQLGKYWSRIAIVDADTLAEVVVVYEESE